MDTPRLDRRDLMKLSLLGAAVVVLPRGGTASARSASELDEDRLPRPYAAPFAAQPVLSSPGGLPPGGQDPDSEEIGYLQYTPLAHPDVPTEPGSMLVSVSRNVTDYDVLLEDPQVGRPLFAEVPRPGTRP